VRPGGSDLTESKDAAAVRIPPPLYPLLACVAGLLLDRVLPLALGFSSPPASHWVGGGIVVGALVFLGAWAVVIFHQEGQRPEPWEPSPTLVARGPFRFTRNPMYVAMLLICLGVAVLTDSLWIVLLTPVAAWALLRFAILPEEAYLERKFGESYLSYKRRVRRWI
jgi:protein-S-isoprenylcysteine O-methyltransferase Ste14